ncbi:hypothetical protein GGR56DRAFT_12393 [Xylariaceae sp. FL0804]|nr:hypothetical protein GGR56DRAFT_12393 [Xylariaceae sp. FL0804]
MSSRHHRPSFGQYDFAFPRETPAHDIARRPRNNSRQLEVPPVSHLGGQIDSSSDDDIPVSNSKRPTRHNRSMSHPFPSLFSSKKKKNVAADEHSGTDELSDSRGYNSKTQSSAPQAASPRKGQLGPPDFAVGNCMTCDGLVRWPKELQVFRCTICTTINDLKPYGLTSSRLTARPVTRGALQTQPNGAGFSGASPQAPNSISLDRTRTLIKACLRSALHHWTSPDSDARPSSSLHVRSASLQREDSPPSQLSPGKQNTPPCSRLSPPSILYNATFDEAGDTSWEPNPLNGNAGAFVSRSHSTSYPDARSSTLPLRPTTSTDETKPNPQMVQLDPKRLFKKLEDYLILCFGAHSCVNNSFVPRQSSVSSKVPPELTRKPVAESKKEPKVELTPDDVPIPELDPKLLLLGDFAENGTWWTGRQEDASSTHVPSRRSNDRPSMVTSRSPRIDWGEAMQWYHAVISAAESWREVHEEMIQVDPAKRIPDDGVEKFEHLLLEAQEHLRRTLLKCTEMLLKRPGRLMADPRDIRFLLLFLANPLLSPAHKVHTDKYQPSTKGKMAGTGPDLGKKSSSGRHSVIIKRILGLLANSSETCQRHLVTWFSKLPDHLLVQAKDIAGGFVTYRLTRQSEKKLEPKIDVTDGLIPQMPSGRAGNTPATLHAALAASKSAKKQKAPPEPKQAQYTDDWQIKAAAKVMALIFAANNLTHVRLFGTSGGRTHRHLFTTSDFYNTLVDTLDFKADFEIWESKKAKFTFCQYPIFLSIRAKIQILEFDAKRQMAGRAREAFFDSIMTHKNYAQYLVLNIRRDCLVEDSLKKVSEVVGSGSEDIKKALRIEFQGEEGIDGGGLRKEWFLLLVREVFNPDHGLFVYDEDSQFCYFNPNTFETSDQYFLVGVLLGLAIYNSTILEVAFPPFAFRKLLASTPASATGGLAHWRPSLNYTLDDLAEFRPALARGLRQLLEYDGDVQSTFCLDFAIDVERYGTRVRVPLCPAGETKMVTNGNRKEYVDLYVRYLLDTSISRQFEPFKRGFFTVCAGSALTLFRPEEIELLVRGSDEPLNITSLRSVAEYQGWPKGSDPETDLIIQWFWDTFERASPSDQRRLLSFITGSDRIPAMGAMSLVIRINCLGEDEGRFPSARTCFNVLSLYRYSSLERLERSLWTAVYESEGFGLK